MISHCEEHVSRIDLYLDKELREHDLENFNRHMEECPSCRERLAERREFFQQIRAVRSLYSVSPQFREKLTALLAEGSSNSGTATTPRTEVTAIGAKKHGRSWCSWLWSRPVPALVACVLGVAVVLIVWRLSLRNARANAFVDMAVETHRLQLAKHLPLEVRTSSPAEMTAWFADRVPFHFRLPSYEKTANQEKKYELVGGCRVNFRGSYAAYVAYRMQSQIISLVVTSASNSVASGGEKTVSKGLTFHAHRREKLQIVTWSVHNLTYALVSGVDLPARQSCVVCHASPKDQNLIRDIEGRHKRKRHLRTLMSLSQTGAQQSAAFR